MNLSQERLYNANSTEKIFFDEVAFEAFFKKHFSSLSAHCQFKYGFNPESAKDIVHNAFVKLWEGRTAITSDFAVIAYLYKIITNNSLDILKHEKVKRQYAGGFLKSEASWHGKNQFENTEHKQLMNDINKAVQDLPEQMRKVFQLCKNEGLKYSEAAAQLNISVKTVEIQMSKALVKIRQQLAHHFTAILVGICLGLIF